MTAFETWSIAVGASAAGATLLAVGVAIWGERIRQLWSGPKLTLELREAEGHLTTRNDKRKGRYYGLVVGNRRPSAPASNVRVLLVSITRRDADGNWRPVTFSAPLQVSWRWPERTPQFTTVGPDEFVTYAGIAQGDSEVHLQLPWCPNNLDPKVSPNQPTRLTFRAVSDSASSALLTVELLWDGVWDDDGAEMARHLKCSQPE